MQCRMLFHADVKLLDMSLGGASIRTNKKLNVGSRYALKIDSKAGQISLRSTVIWSKIAELKKDNRGNTVPYYDIGLNFDETATDRGDELLDFIHNRGLADSAKARLKGLRVDLLKPESTRIVGYHKSFQVSQIGVGGILIETEQKMKVGSTFRMEMNLPDEKEMVKFLCRVASSLEISGSVPKRYETGLNFVEMSDHDRSRLHTFIDFLQNL